MPIHPTSHMANQADGKTKMSPTGEVHVTLNRGSFTFTLQAVVVQDLDCDILGGGPFLKFNGIVLDMPCDRIIIQNKETIHYSSPIKCHPQIRRSNILKPSQKQVLYPGEYIELDTHFPEHMPIAIEPRSDSDHCSWIQPAITTSVCGRVRIPNLTDDIVTVKKHDHLAQIHLTATPNDLRLNVIPDNIAPASIKVTKAHVKHSEPILLDPQLSSMHIQTFNELHSRYDSVFNRDIGKYNDASGRIRASINMGPVEPPPQKARLPSYDSVKMRLLQEKMDELECLGVLAKPEDVGVTVEHVSPSFLVHKPDGTHRLVTAFNAIGTYAKPLPSRSVCTDDVLRFLSAHEFIIKTDMTKQFFQLPMHKGSMKYLGVLTPYKGLRVYTRAAMGMPGSTEHLDELLSRVLGDLIQQGRAVKLADDLYTGGNSIAELLHNWEGILQRFEANNLRLSASKTEICPSSTTILGWIWSSGKIRASTHKISPIATATLPSTVKGLRSWLGAYKHLRVCIPKSCGLLSRLETMVAGKESRASLHWSDDEVTAFHTAQKALSSVKCITIPRPEDKLVITNDGAVKCGGIGSVLFVCRGKTMLLGGFFSAKLKSHQLKWLPCEVEPLAISSAVSHWAPYILESRSHVQIFTDYIHSLNIMVDDGEIHKMVLSC